MLGHLHLFPIHILHELLVDLDDFLEVQLLEVDIHPAYEEVDEIALLQLVVPHAPKRLEHLGEFAVEFVEGGDLGHALPVLVEEVHAASH